MRRATSHLRKLEKGASYPGLEIIAKLAVAPIDALRVLGRRPTGLYRPANNRHHFVDRQPRLRCMDHPVTVGAQEAKIPHSCLVARAQCVNGVGV